MISLGQKNSGMNGIRKFKIRRIIAMTKTVRAKYSKGMRQLQKSKKGPFCHSELVEELRQIKQLEHPSTGSG